VLAILDREVDNILEKRPLAVRTPARARRHTMSSGLEARQARAGWLFSSPALLLIAVFFFVPVIAGLVLSLTDFDLYSIADLSNARFIGFRNYQRLLVDPVFWKALSEHRLLRHDRRRALGHDLAWRRAARESEARACARRVSARCCSPGRDHARRGRDRMALPLSPALLDS
jgi:hypothetical protein